MELQLLQLGQAVPVSPRDNHLIHLNVLMPIAEQAALALMQGQTETAVFETLLAHINEHYNNAVQQGAPKEALAEVDQLIKKSGAALAQLKELDAKAQELQAQTAQHDAENQQIMSGSSPQQ